MDVWFETGTDAGKILEVFDCENQMEFSSLKKKSKVKNLELAVGWLLREDKIKVEKIDGNFVVSLK